eukprot:6194858-Alexandrium_andersonii.AAC.1
MHSRIKGVRRASPRKSAIGSMAGKSKGGGGGGGGGGGDAGSSIGGTWVGTANTCPGARPGPTRMEGPPGTPDGGEAPGR